MIEAHSKDVISSLILLKREIEERKRTSMKVTITGASEAHLLARELAESDIGVIVNPTRPFPAHWEDRNMSVIPGVL